MPFSHHYITAPDGVKLHYSEIGHSHPGVPVLCLPGLSRPAADFDKVAQWLTSGKIGPPRRVVQIDYRGRGLSGWDTKPENYSVPVEHADMLQVLKVAGIDRAIFLGTSRGGLQTMFTAAQKPGLIAAAIMNDIGPVIESEGLQRIKNYVGKFPPVKTWQEIIDILKIGMAEHFPAVTDAEFETYAHISFVEKDGVISMRYDPALTAALAAFDLSQPIPPAWSLFALLNGLPLLILRGATSDLFTRQTAGEMMLRHEGAEFYEIAGQGHAPLLLDDPTCERIARFVAKLP